MGGSVYCIALIHPRSVEIVRNVLTVCGQQGIQLGSPGANPEFVGGGNLIQDNAISQAASGIGLYSSDGNIVRNNTIRECSIGIIVDSANNKIADNVISNSYSTAPCGGGMCVQGDYSLFEGNVVEGTTGTGCGIHFFRHVRH